MGETKPISINFRIANHCIPATEEVLIAKFVLDDQSSVTMTSAVQSKIPCILKTVVRELPSTKRAGQNYCVEASNELCDCVVSSDLKCAIATEKIDGTCCHIRKLNGKLMLWARLDRKPDKRAEKRFKAFQRKHREWEATKYGVEPEFRWKFPDDLKAVPDEWIPADGVDIDEASQCPIPDQNGHIPGWVPVDSTTSQYCWHSSVVDYDLRVALTLKPVYSDEATTMEISATPLSELEGNTLELIGTNINGNPYSLGDKQHPFHILIEHGCIPTKGLSEITHENILNWFEGSQFSKVEGIVWHFKDRRMYKLHRHHLKLPWPLLNKELPSLSSSAIRIIAKIPPSYTLPNKSMLNILTLFDGKRFDRLCDIPTNFHAK